MSRSGKVPFSERSASTSARLNAWAADTLATITSEEGPAKADKDAPVREDGNSHLAWAAALVFPWMIFMGLAIEVENSLEFLFWGISIASAIGVFVNVIQTLWAKRRRAALDSKQIQGLLVNLELQRRQIDELLIRIKTVETNNGRSAPSPD